MKATTFTIPSFLPFPTRIRGPLDLVFASLSATIERQVSLTRNGLRNTALSIRKAAVLHCRAQVVPPTPRVVLAVVILYHLVLEKVFVVKDLL
jgi:hypothetical protein